MCITDLSCSTMFLILSLILRMLVLNLRGAAYVFLSIDLVNEEIISSQESKWQFVFLEMLC
jgi:hypothetical protein